MPVTITIPYHLTDKLPISKATGFTAEKIDNIFISDKIDYTFETLNATPLPAPPGFPNAEPIEHKSKCSKERLGMVAF
jgi:hypothetical protein